MKGQTQDRQVEHEQKLVRSFILPARQQRYLELLAKPRRRKDITHELAHFKHLDMKRAIAIPSRRRHPSEILKLLKSKGAPDLCYVISEDDDLDGKEMPLVSALAIVIGYGLGTFLSCLPGQLAYFEDEDQQWILERRTNS